MGLLDAIGYDQTTTIKCSTYYELMKRAVLADILIKGMQEGVPVEYLKKIAGDKKAIEIEPKQLRDLFEDDNVAQDADTEE